MTRQRMSAIGVAGVVVLAAACGGSSSEESLERLIEEETGEDVEIDFDDGGISVESDEGSFSVDEEGQASLLGGRDANQDRRGGVLDRVGADQVGIVDGLGVGGRRRSQQGEAESKDEQGA